MQRGDGLDALLQLLRAQLHALYLPGTQVVGHLEHQEEDTQRLFLDGVPLPVLNYLSTEGQQWVDFLQLALHQQ